MHYSYKFDYLFGRNGNESVIEFFHASDVERISNRSGIYIWFSPIMRSIPKSLQNLLDLFKKQIEDAARFSAKELKGVDSNLYANIENRPKLAMPNEAESANLAEETLYYLALVLSLSQLLNEAVYIGVSKNIQNRIKQHLNDETIKKRVGKDDFVQGNCLLLTLRFDRIPGLSQELQEKLAVKLEPILIQAFNPQTNVKLG